MSDQYITIIPEIPDFVPDQAKQLNSIAYFRSITSPGTELYSSISDKIKFVDCGGNFENIKCPSCGANIDIEAWQSWMGMDFDGEGFTLNLHKITCCGANHTLNELKYHFPQGFARFQLSAMNPDVGQLSENHIASFVKIFDCSIRIIYQHY